MDVSSMIYIRRYLDLDLDLFYFPSKNQLTTKYKTESKMAEVQLKAKCLWNVAPPYTNTKNIKI